MGEVVELKKFKKPREDKAKHIYRKPAKGKSVPLNLRNIVIHLPRYKFNSLYKKAEKECRTAYPVHDVLCLLVDYYLRNEFIISRRMICVDDPTATRIVKIKRKRKYEKEAKFLYEQPKRINISVPQTTYKAFTEKVKRDGMNTSHTIETLVDFYLNHSFIIKTKIIRTNLYRTRNKRSDTRFFSDFNKQTKILDSLDKE